MKEIEKAKSQILEQIHIQLEDDVKYGKIEDEYWLEVLNKEYLESFAYFEILKASESIENDLIFSKFVRGILEFVKAKRFEILFKRKYL